MSELEYMAKYSTLLFTSSRMDICNFQQLRVLAAKAGDKALEKFCYIKLAIAWGRLAIVWNDSGDDNHKKKSKSYQYMYDYCISRIKELS